MFYISHNAVAALRTSKHHSSGRAKHPGWDESPDAPRLEWHHMLADYKHEHMVILIGPTAEVRVVALEPDDVFPCDVDLDDKKETQELWRLWRKAQRVPPEHKRAVLLVLEQVRQVRDAQVA